MPWDSGTGKRTDETRGREENDMEEVAALPTCARRHVQRKQPDSRAGIPLSGSSLMTTGASNESLQVM